MLWKVFNLVPGLTWAVIVFVLAVFAGSSYVRMTHAQTALAVYRAEVADATRRAEVESRAKERDMHNQVERISDDAAKKQSALASHAASADRLAGQLRDEVARLNARPTTPDTPVAAIAGEARVARELFGACTDRYAQVAREADQLRDQVTGLQDFAASVGRP